MTTNAIVTKRADQLENGDNVVLEYQSNRFLGVVIAVMQFRSEGSFTNVALQNPDTGGVCELKVPNNTRFEILAIH